MMELTVLGCWAPYPAPGGCLPGYLIETDRTMVLLECGSGVLSRFLQLRSLRELDAAVVSHFHPDHFTDLYHLRHALQLDPERQERSLPLFAPARPRKYSKEIQSWPIFQLTAVPVRKEPFSVCFRDLELIFHRTVHPLPCLAVRIEDGKTSIGYTADTAFDPALIRFLAGVDLLISECSLIEADHARAAKGHLTAAQAGRLAALTGAGKVLLTHFWPGYDREELWRQAQDTSPVPVELAAEGHCYAIAARR